MECLKCCHYKPVQMKNTNTFGSPHLMTFIGNVEERKNGAENILREHSWPLRISRINYQVFVERPSRTFFRNKVYSC